MYDFTEEFEKQAMGLFQSEMGIEHPTVPVKFDDIFKQPKTGMWAEFCFRQNKQTQVSIGGKFIVRTTGFIQIDIMAHGEEGSKRAALKMCEFATNIFAYRKFKGETISIDYGEKHVEEPRKAAEFIRVMGRVFFIYDGTRTRETVQAIT